MNLSPPMMVNLTPSQIEFATFVGARRQREAEKGGWIDASGAQFTFEQALAAHVFGAMGERAARAFLHDEVEWATNSVGAPADLAGFIDVKAVRKAHHCMIVDPAKLRREIAYLLVDGTAHPSWRIVGWLWGREVEALKDCLVAKVVRRPIRYYVPQDRLWRRPMMLWDEVVERNSK